jgi:hypothetical protein
MLGMMRMIRGGSAKKPLRRAMETPAAMDMSTESRDTPGAAWVSTDATALGFTAKSRRSESRARSGSESRTWSP